MDLEGSGDDDAFPDDELDDLYSGSGSGCKCSSPFPCVLADPAGCLCHTYPPYGVARSKNPTSLFCSGMGEQTVIWSLLSPSTKMHHPHEQNQDALFLSSPSLHLYMHCLALPTDPQPAGGRYNCPSVAHCSELFDPGEELSSLFSTPWLRAQERPFDWPTLS